MEYAILVMNIGNSITIYISVLFLLFTIVLKFVAAYTGISSILIINYVQCVKKTYLNYLEQTFTISSNYTK